MKAQDELAARRIATRETWVPVGDGKAHFSSRFRFRTARWVARQNAGRFFPSYRYEVVREGNRYEAVAFQNQAVQA